MREVHAVNYSINLSLLKIYLEVSQLTPFFYVCPTESNKGRDELYKNYQLTKSAG